VRLPGIGRLAVVSALVLVCVGLVAPTPFMLEPAAGVSEREAAAAIRYLRRCLDRGEVARVPALLEARRDATLPMVVTVWKEGRRALVRQAAGRPLPDALGQIARALASSGERLRHPTTRIQLDLAVADGWVPRDGLLFSLAFVEGHDGISGLVDGERVYVPPAELVRSRRYGSFKPLPGYDPRFRIGIDAGRVQRVFRSQAREAGHREGDATDLRRFSSLAMVEGRDLIPRRLMKGTVARPAVDRARAEAAVLAGARYLERALGADGVFRYNYDPLQDRVLRDKYNWPRHAGVAYSLALVGRTLRQPQLNDAARRALVRFEEQLAQGPDGTMCLLAGGTCYIGSSALGLLAVSEYRISTGDTRFDRSAARVAAFLRYMQREDGTFNHEWYPDAGVDTDLMKLYASQQAVLALARYARAVGDDEALTAAAAGMDHLAGPYWDFFLGTYFFGQEHWSCLAAEELHSRLPRPEYARYCHAIGVHYDNLTHNAGDTPFPEDVGGMSITHMFTPGTGGTATAAEAMISAVILGRAEGLDVSSIERQVADTCGFLIRCQVTDHDTFWTPAPENSVGAFFTSQSDSRVRIDTVQHAMSALVRALDILGPRSANETATALSDYSLAF